MSTKRKKTTKKPSKPRTIEVEVATATATTVKPPKAKSAKNSTAEPPAASPDPVATGAKPAGKKRNIVKARNVERLSALDAAAQVLAGADPMTTEEMIEAMSALGLWITPGGKTPHATL